MAAKDIEAGRQRLKHRLQHMASPNMHRAEQTMNRFGQAVAIVAPIVGIGVNRSIVVDVFSEVKKVPTQL